MKPVLFIGSSTHGLSVARAIKDELAKLDAASVMLWEDLFGLTGQTFSTVLGVLPRADVGLLVLTGDDWVRQKRKHSPWRQLCPRDNAILELGLVLGALGPERTIYAIPADKKLALPTDLDGVQAVKFGTSNSKSSLFQPGIEDAAREIRRWLSRKEFGKHTCATVTWNTERGSINPLNSERGEPEHSVLLVGNTMANINEDYKEDIDRWLTDKQERIFGRLMLNPHSPHALHRDRQWLDRGTRERGLQVYRDSLSNPIHQRYLTLAYDGPYRYSSRILDGGTSWDSQASAAFVLNSTHLKGTDRALHTSIPQGRGSDCFGYYRDDAVDLWKSAHANPPGHGMSIVVPCEPENDAWHPNVKPLLTRTADRLIELATSKLNHQNHPGEAHLLFPRQWHVTLSSLIRTGLKWGWPISLEGSNQNAMESYLSRCLKDLQPSLPKDSQNQFSFQFTHAKLTQTGHLCLFHPDPSPFPAMEQFLSSRQEALVASGLDPETNPEFAPKHSGFQPHLTFGLAFHNQSALPLPLENDLEEGPTVELETPIAVASSEISIVHYAYRSLLRLIGEVRVPIESWAHPAVQSILHRLSVL